MQWTADDVLCTDKYWRAFPNAYYKTDVFYFDRPFEWRGQRMERPYLSIPLLITGHSDFSVGDMLANRYPMTTWFSVNSQSSRIRGLPLGITNDTNESDLHRIYGNVNAMVEVAQQPRDIKNLVYMNFSCDTYPSERIPVWNLFASKPWVTVEQHVPTMDGRRQYLTSIRNHSFVLCPRGNGVDTHRLWETLYMGSIPIVREDIAHRDWTDLPILFVKDWTEVTEELLQKVRMDFPNRQWNWNKLKASYWIQNIQNESRNNPYRN